LIAQGHLKIVEYKLTEILSNSTASQSLVDEFLDDLSAYLTFCKGEWTQALEFYRYQREEYRQEGRLWEVAGGNLLLVLSCLDLDRFAGLADLSEAEAALQENIEMRRITFTIA
jgi:hypothetical protein